MTQLGQKIQAFLWGGGPIVVFMFIVRRFYDLLKQL